MTLALALGLALYVLGSAADVASSVGLARTRGWCPAPALREGNRLWARRDGSFRALPNVVATVLLGAIAACIGLAAPLLTPGVALGLGLGGAARGAVGLRNARLRGRHQAPPSGRGPLPSA